MWDYLIDYKFLMHRVELKEKLVFQCFDTFLRFLMHRVELKDGGCLQSLPLLRKVPNAPCGVESKRGIMWDYLIDYKFLMHRVELKEKLVFQCFDTFLRFLMHRVELKDGGCLQSLPLLRKVPNAPCGVERCVKKSIHQFIIRVPNAPCGVESSLQTHTFQAW